MQLTNSQQRVRDHRDGHAVVIAVAGAGKTTALSQRVVSLCKTTLAERILLLTFTTKAAESATARLAALSSPAYVCTFHSFCYRWLKVAHAPFQQGKILPANLEWMRVMWADAAVKGLIGIEGALFLDLIDKFHSAGIDPFSVTTFDGRERQAYKKYHESLREENYYEVGELPVLLLSILRNNPEFRQRLQKQYSYVMVDEYQDTDQCQEQILEILCGRPGVEEGRTASASLMVVGDPSQAIYAFRNADTKLIRNFQARWGAAKYVMAENFRSGPAIIKVANKLMNRELEAPMVATQLDLPSKVRVATFQSESGEIGKIILKMKSSGMISEWRDSAVLFRTNAQSAAFESAFTDAGIPYVTKDVSEGFFGMGVVKTLISYLRVAVYEDIGALRYVWNRPVRYLKTKILDDAIKSSGRTIPEILSSAATMQRGNNKINIDSLINLIKCLRESVEVGDVTANLLQFIINSTNYRNYLEGLAKKNSDRPLADYAEPAELVNQLVKIAEKKIDVRKFLMHVDRVIDNAKQKNSQKNGVNLLTIHSAKGAEFTAVFIAGMIDKLMPHSNAIQPAARIEEKRLAYVAVTRAKQYLCISTLIEAPSPYIAEMGLTISPVGEPADNVIRSKEPVIAPQPIVRLFGDSPVREIE